MQHKRIILPCVKCGKLAIKEEEYIYRFDCKCFPGNFRFSVG